MKYKKFTTFRGGKRESRPPSVLKMKNSKMDKISHRITYSVSAYIIIIPKKLYSSGVYAAVAVVCAPV